METIFVIPHLACMRKILEFLNVVIKKYGPPMNTVTLMWPGRLAFFLISNTNSFQKRIPMTYGM